MSCCFFFENMPPRPLTIRADGVVGNVVVARRGIRRLGGVRRPGVLRGLGLLARLLSGGNTHAHADSFEHRQALELGRILLQLGEALSHARIDVNVAGRNPVDLFRHAAVELADLLVAGHRGSHEHIDRHGHGAVNGLRACRHGLAGGSGVARLGSGGRGDVEIHVHDGFVGGHAENYAAAGGRSDVELGREVDLYILRIGLRLGLRRRLLLQLLLHLLHGLLHRGLDFIEGGVA